MNKAVALKLAGAAALAGSTQAYGQIVTVAAPTNISGFDPNNGTPKTVEFYNVFTGVTTDSFVAGDDFRFEYGNFPGYFGGGTLLYTGMKAYNGLGTEPSPIAATQGAFYVYADALTPGTKIGTDNAGLQFISYGASSTVLAQGYTVTATGNDIQSGTQQIDTPTIVGFQVADATGALHNGYIELETQSYTSPTSPGGLVFTGAAYDSIPDGQAGGDIVAAPEPGTISSLMLGAAALGGVGLLRRRRSMLA
jgi:hypothetical protein